MVPFVCIEGCSDQQDARIQFDKFEGARGKSQFPDGDAPKGMNMNFLCSDRKPSAPHLMRAFAIICASVSVLAGCGKPSVRADQPIPVQVRAPHRLHEPASVFASGSV